MVNVTVKMHNLQELIRKTHLEGLVRDVVVIFSDGRMKIEAIGTQDEQGVVDKAITLCVDYPCESTTESGEIALENIGTFLSNLELFERDDIVTITSTTKEVYITRISPNQQITYELADKKFIKTYSEGLKTIFGNPIRLIKLDGKEKVIAFDSSVTVDAQKLKEHGAKISKIKAKNVPISIKDGKLNTSVKGEVSGISREVEGVTSATGNASSTFIEGILKILKQGIGTATLRFSEGTPIHVHYEHETMKADYLVQVYTEK